MGRASTFRAAALCALALAQTGWALNPDHRITQYVHRIWQTQPGLPQPSIIALMQSHDGFLWLATQEGVVRFDGIRFTPVRALENSALGSIVFRKMVEDASGKIWLLSDDSVLVRLDQDQVKVFDDTPYTCIVPGEAGAVWACTPKGLVRFDGDRRQAFIAAEPFPTDGVVPGCLCEKDHKMWIGAGSSVITWNGGYQQFFLRSVPRDALIRAVLCGEDATWFGTSQGLVRLKGGQETLFTVHDGLPDNLVIALARGARGSIWVGTRNGLARLSPKSSGGFGTESFGYREGLSQRAALDVMEDREGSLWVGTGNGLNQFLDGAATRFTRNEGLPGDNTGPVLVDHTGKLWVGSLDGGLAYYNGRQFSPLPSMSAARIRTLTEDADGALWAGTDSGILRLEGGKIHDVFTVAQGLPSNQIRSLFRDSAGRMWVGTELGPAVQQGKSFVQDAALAATLRVPILGIGESKNAKGESEILFAAERTRVYAYRAGELRQITDRIAGRGAFTGQTPPLAEVNSLYTDPGGVTWIGTNGVGIGMLRNGKLWRFFQRDGLLDPEIYGFVADARDNLWMAGSKGFFWVKRSDFFDLAAGKIRKVSSIPYRPVDGFLATQGTPGVTPIGSISRDSGLWLSAGRAVLDFAPETAGRLPAPPVEVETISVNGAVTSPDHIRTLGPGRENVAIDYTALTFIVPQRLTFRYMLEGYDKDWTDAGERRQAFYTNLPPGKFRFRVRACGVSVPCSESSSAALAFEILPEFYQRIWFLPALGASLALLGWLTFRLRVRQMRTQFGLVLAERNRIARELHDTLIQGFSGITMQLQAMTGRIRSVDDKETLEEIIQDAGKCLRETRRSVAGLRGDGTSGGLAAAIADVARQATEERDIRLKLRLDDDGPDARLADEHQLHDNSLPAEIKYNLVCIAQEALVNAAKHSGARTIEVSLATEQTARQRELVLTIQDDGIGLHQSSGEPGHYGLVGMRERARHIGAEFEVSSLPSKGTTISVRLPRSKHAPGPVPSSSISKRLESTL